MDNEQERLLAEYDARRRRIERVVIVILLIVLAGLLALEAFIFDFKGSFPAPYNLLFFMLLNVNLILIFILLFLVFRNLAKLIFERRAKVLGSKLRTKLIVAFAAFALVPTVAFFYVAMSFITNSIERWFSIQVESSLSESLEVAQAYYESHEDSAKFFAGQLAQGIYNRADPKTGLVEFPNPVFEEYLKERKIEYNVDSVDVYLKGKKSSVFSLGYKGKAPPVSDQEKRLMEKGWKGGVASGTIEKKTGEAIVGIAPVDFKGDVKALVVVRYQIAESLLMRMRRILTAYEEYTQLQVLEEPLKTSYLIILLLISSFIFFGAIWFGFLLSRGLVIPLQRLADGTRKVAEGDLNVQIEAMAKDEIGFLVQNFNTMTDRLRESRYALEQTADKLSDSNIELERRRAYIETVLGNITAGVISFDEQGRISTINAGAKNILGLDEQNAEGKEAKELFDGQYDDKISNLIEALEKSRDNTVERQVEVIVRGRKRYLQVSLARLTDKAGGRAGTVVVLDDLTELLKAQRMAAWQEVARRIAHEIKNPLTPIKLSAQRLRKRYGSRFGDDDVFFESTSTIIQQVEELKTMVNAFSSFARMAEPAPDYHDVNQVLSEAVILYSEAHKNIRFDLEKDDQMPKLYCDRDQVKRMFINIIDNAVSSIEGRGSIRVSSKADLAKKMARFVFEDTGCGLPEEYMDRIFEPYFSTKKMGTGLGLAIVNQIVTELSGTIRLEANEPEGTRVIVEIPVRTE